MKSGLIFNILTMYKSNNPVTSIKVGELNQVVGNQPTLQRTAELESLTSEISHSNQVLERKRNLAQEEIVKVNLATCDYGTLTIHLPWASVHEKRSLYFDPVIQSLDLKPLYC